jgi:SNF2 family DNA or RNA helicase
MDFEVQLVPGADRVLKEASVCTPNLDLYRLRLQAEHLLLVAGFDELISLKKVGFTPFGYQIKAAQTVLARFRGRGLLCDEVGLGKTIEAGLVLKEYLLRRLVDRMLILTPPALVEQWREELSVKFGLADFITHADPEFCDLGSQAWATFPRVIASLATARRPEHRRQILQIPYDLVVVDEAHHLKNRASVSWKFVNALQRKYILLLTATPVQNDLEELYNLITLLKPGQLKTHREFRRQFVAPGDPRQPQNRGHLRELLADVMVRHTRSQVSVAMPPRHAHTLRLSLAPEERALYNDVSAFVRARFTPGEDGRQESSANRFTLGMLQRQIGSSPQAAAPTLHRLAEEHRMKPHQEMLLALARRAAQIRSWAKAEALDKLLTAVIGSDRHEKVIIFTHFRRTLELLAERLRAMGLEFVAYHGELPVEIKDDVINRFERDFQVLLSTEAAGEGRNLQFCRTMINVDLPWNPMRIEQRVGRIHRIGQTREVNIYNMSARGTLEDHILDILDRKLNMFELVIGETGMILGHLQEERDFEDLVMDVWTRSRTDEEVVAGFTRLGEALAQARRAYQRAREYDEALFGEDFTAE